LLGTLNMDGTGNPLTWMAPVTENPAVGATEVWEIHNFTMDAHPIHIHLVQFQVVDREVATALSPKYDGGNIGAVFAPELWESGFKDTVIAYPGEITRVVARFDVAGLFVWHCHILEHEDNEMMRPYRVGP
jgi:bilirubin oxidase